ncbi:MAG: SPOR domain-containing protein [Hyphomicrobium sp.]|uniref:SPOR domain-containing protein n=1 Tax=Hyphomicrobium sp. TaxID=82 RepID=UPI003D133121
MTRYSNPLANNQGPNTQGRPAGSGQPAQPSPYDQAGWPPPNGGQQRPAYAPDPSAGQQQPGLQHDPYAALRPDGYGYGQPQQPTAADPYGLAGYTAPQPQAQPQPGYGVRSQQQAPQQPSYGAAGDPYGNSGGYGGHPAAQAPSPYGAAPGYGAQPPAPQSPYGNTGYGSQPAPAPQHGGQWGAPSLGMDARDYGYGGQWGSDHYGEPQLEPSLGSAGGYPGGPQHAQQQGSFDQSYVEDEAQYDEEPRRGGWKKVVGLVICTVLVGGALIIAYTTIMPPGGETPLVKGDDGPSKVKPSDPGGKKFAHAESKIMGRLGEGGEEEAATPAGVRKVPVVTVGPDGSIQPPAAQQEETRAMVAVPGLTVIGGLDAGGPSPTRPAGTGQVQMVAAAEPKNSVVVAPPEKPKKQPVADDFADPPAKPVVKADPPPKKEKVAAATPPPSTGSTGAGYVAVLASVPASGSSRMDALKQFADMQQKYGTILNNKTPDIQEANLGEKGTYHRLMVGPPGSRDSASSVCTQLKAQGYSGCWVTAY